MKQHWNDKTGKWAPPTNADRFRSMSEEKLAETLICYNGDYDDYKCSDGQVFRDEKEAIDHEIFWLRLPTREE